MTTPVKGNAVNDKTTLVLPYPRLSEGHFSFVHAFTDETLFEQCKIRIAFTCRDGGVSAPPFDELNLGDHVSDDTASVVENRRRVLEAFLGQDMCDLASLFINPVQVHGKRVVVCDDRKQILHAIYDARKGADAVVACDSHVPVMLCYADCVPIIVVAPTGDFAVIHAGWRGVVNKISEAAIRMLCSHAHVLAHECNVYIGPYIHACHFEVGDETIAAFRNEFGESCFADDCHVDMGCALRMTFEQCGIDKNRIADVGLCTVDNQDKFFSYRKAQGVCGRHAAFAVSLQDEGY